MLCLFVRPYGSKLLAHLGCSHLSGQKRICTSKLTTPFEGKRKALKFPFKDFFSRESISNPAKTETSVGHL